MTAPPEEKPAYRRCPDPASAALPLTALHGVGVQTAERLARLGIHCVEDLLFHLPLRYEDRSRVLPVASLRPGRQAMVEVAVQREELRMGRRRSLLVHCSDGTGPLALRFFHFNARQRALFRPGTRLRCFGEVRSGPACYEMVHPEFELPGSEAADAAAEACLTPVYPSTEGLHQLSWRRLTGQALASLREERLRLTDWIPAAAPQSSQLPTLAQALQLLHRPPRDTDLAALQDGRHPAQRRLILEELVAHQLSLRQLRRRVRRHVAPACPVGSALEHALRQQLPFELTLAQRRVLAEIQDDLAGRRPMLRLVQGDVGCGKTVVAAIAAAQVLASGHQVALMAPTELLAEQHARTLEQWFAPLGMVPARLSGRLPAAARRELLSGLAEGGVPLAVGTHALFQQDVVFSRLGLVIIDEQHRFGVHQRLALRDKGQRARSLPHQLVMTATPIPRSLAMTAYADLDLSIIDALPPGRSPVTTVLLPDARRDAVIERVRRALQQGRQAYWVCTLIEESEALECQAAEDTAATLRERLPGLQIGLVHGRTPASEREQIMAAFKTGALDLLVATTVIEVGVDVPNASLMIIENAERLGLAQLHQLRGRVGRGPVASHCLLLYHPPLSGLARERLAVMRASNDGFRIARKDLELRGPGELLGTRQTGELRFRVADLVRDGDLLEAARELADLILAEAPQAATPLVDRWLGDGQRYAMV